MKNFKIILGLLVFSLAVLKPAAIFAADLFLLGESDIRTGDLFELKAVVSSEEVVNATEGRILFPAQNLEIKELRFGSSILSLWIEEPNVVEPGIINFSGITPGGWQGKSGLLFTMVFQVKKEGLFNLEADGVRILKHDGRGTPVAVNIKPLEISVFKNTTTTELREEPVSFTEDSEAPESFIPEIVSDLSFYDGRKSVVFYTQDKGVGIDHYEIKEVPYKFLSFLFPYRRASSPVELEDQNLTKTIFIKAVDKNGNSRVVVVPARNPLSWYARWEAWLLIVVVLVFLLYFSRKILRAISRGDV